MKKPLLSLMNVKLKKINNEEVKPRIKGKKKPFSHIVAEPYANIFICGRKRSGKTNVADHLIRHLMNVDKDLVLVVFSKTLHKDEIWNLLRKKYEKKGRFLGFSSLEDKMDENSPKGIFDQLIEEHLNQGALDDEETLKWIFVFDDFSEELKDKRINHFVKVNRWMPSFNIFSSQFCLDLKPEARKQIGLWLLFPQIEKEKLFQIYQSADPPTDFETFLRLYKDATNERYNFLYMDAVNGTFRKNFNKKYIIEDFEN